MDRRKGKERAVVEESVSSHDSVEHCVDLFEGKPYFTFVETNPDGSTRHLQSFLAYTFYSSN